MNKVFVSCLTGVFLAGTALAQTTASSATAVSGSQNTAASANRSGAQAQSSTAAGASHTTDVSKAGNQAQAASQLQSGSTIHAVLTKPVDAKKSKPGDEVVAKSTEDVKSQGHVVIPRGSKIVGHVTEVKARQKGQSDSTVGIAFDHAVLKDGSQVPVPLAVQAISSSNAMAQSNDEVIMPISAAPAPMASGRASGGGLLGGVGSTASGAVGATGGLAGGTLNTATSAGGAVSAPLNSNSQGVVGMPGLNLGAASSGGSTITSRDSNVHLDSGTQMILRVDQ